MTVLIIALIPAVLVFIIAAWTESKLALIIAAIIAGIIGIATGNPIYTAIDLIAVVLGFVLGLLYINAQKPRPNFEVKETTHQTAAPIYVPKANPAPNFEVKAAPPLEKKNPESSWGGGIAMLIFGAAAIFNAFKDKPAPPTPPVQVQQQSVTHSNLVQPSRTAPPSEPTKKRVANSNKGSSDLRHCLNQRTDAEIAKCANQRK